MLAVLISRRRPRKPARPHRLLTRVARLAGAVACLGFFAVQAQLPEWVRFVEGDSPLRSVFFQTVSLPSGPIVVERAPTQTHAALTVLLRAAPEDTDLYALRARESERRLDLVAAEKDWQQYAAFVSDPAEGQLALADYYHRRLRPREEIEALLKAGRSPATAAETLHPVSEHRSWKAFERIFALVEAHALGGQAVTAYHRARLERFPGQTEAHRALFDHLVEQEMFDEARATIDGYAGVFPDDETFPIQAQAALTRREGSEEETLAFYERSFEPLWPENLIQSYFSLLQEAGRLRRDLDRMRARLNGDPNDLRSAAWIFHYYRRQGNPAVAQSWLNDFRRNKEAGGVSWISDELRTAAELFLRVNNYNEAARYHYALYSLPGATDEEHERALGGLIDLLLTAPEQPIRFGSGDLSLYSDIATMDDHPGFLNGILSLLFNSESPRGRFASQERTAAAYFHRARAAELLERFDRRFAGSARRPALHLKLLEAYATYGDNDGVIDGCREFLSAFPDSPQRTKVALLLAEAYARAEQVELEFQTYDALLNELAARADRVPLGSTGERNRPPSYGGRFAYRQAIPPARSPEYARVLDRYIARLVSMKRVLDAIGLYSNEIARNPNDPGLYARLAGFLEQNNLAERVDQVYRQAIARFQDPSWHHKLARWYLRTQKRAEWERLSREVIETFSGTDLDTYFREFGGGAADVYVRLNRYALERFPHNLTFVRNLLRAYEVKRPRDRVAWDRLIRQYWFYADDLRSRFFEYLNRTGRLAPEIYALRTSLDAAGGGRWNRLVRQNAAAAQFLAETELWRCHYEEAAPVMMALASHLPGDAARAERTASLHRSLAYENPLYTDASAALTEGRQRYDPRDRDLLARVGDTFADRERFERSKPFWERMAVVEPGKPQGYLEAATVFWDYYLFDDALRLMSEGRRALDDEALYAYEAGAVHENQREYGAAIEEYLKGALHGEGYSPARRRLIQLASRPAHRDRIESLTVPLAAGADPNPDSVSLRVDVLAAQKRDDDIDALLPRLAASTSSFELLDRLRNIAAARRNDEVRLKVLERQIELTSDPLDRTRLRLSLMHQFEDAKRVEPARQVIETLYREQPRILGVVRGAVDFHWRQKSYGRALALLDQSAEAAYPVLAERFRFESAQKAAETGRYARARGTLESLLAPKPYEPRYVAAMADMYAREGRYDALRDFYERKIGELRQASIPHTQRNQQVASLRRGLIPALTKLGDPAAAVDQYIEIINRFPDDAGLVMEACFYADRHDRREQLTNYYVKTTGDSPRDFRYHRVLAWVHTHFENLPAAIEAYGRAIQVRPDSTEVFEARAALEVRLLRFDDALATYQQLYRLRYEDPRWMEKMAQVYARQGRRAEAVAAARKALIEGRPPRPEHYFAAARRLAAWGYVPEARDAAEEGIDLAGDRLFHGSYSSGVQLYVSLMTRLREYGRAADKLERAWATARPEFRRGSFPTGLQVMASVVKRDYTPEEKGEFVSFLEAWRARVRPAASRRVLLTIARNAGLAELEAKWLHEFMLAAPGASRTKTHRRRLIELQRRRLHYRELGQQLETFWRAYPAKPDKDSILREAAEAYRDAEDEDAEFRVLDSMDRRSSLSGALRERYFEMLLTRRPDWLVELARSDAAANYAVAVGGVELALRAVESRGRKLPPVWTRAYKGLAGLHYNHWTPEVNESFRAALGGGTIGERVGKPVDREQQLAGDLWFYYGSRYGEYLANAGEASSEDYLPAMIETAPGRSSAYFSLAEYYRQGGEAEPALREYGHTLELSPATASAHRRMAGILWEEGRREEAISHWEAALDTFRIQVNRGAAAESFWDDVPALIREVSGRGLRGRFGDAIYELLGLYVQRNGGYRVGPLLRAVFETSDNPPGELARILDLAAKANNALSYLSVLVRARWLPDEHRETVLQHTLEAARGQIGRTRGQGRFYAQQAYDQWQVRWIEYLLETKQAAKAQAAVDDASETMKQALRHQQAPLAIRVAALAGRLDEVLAEYAREDDEARASSRNVGALRQAAVALAEGGDDASAHRLLDFYYTRLLSQRRLNAANFLGLAELRLQQGRVEEARSLLRRMVLVAGEPFEHHRQAAALLVESGRPADARAFLEQRVEAAPWDREAGLELALAQLSVVGDEAPAGRSLAAIASATEATYELRTTAATALVGVAYNGENLGSRELELLAGGAIAPDDAARPFFLAARHAAAEQAGGSTARLRLLREAVAIRPDSRMSRLDLFRTARQQRQHQLAVQALRSVASGGRWGGLLSRRDSVLFEQPNGNAIDEYTARQFLGREGLLPEVRARLAHELGASLEQVGRLGAAVSVYEAALHLGPPAGEREAIEQGLARVKSARRRQAESAARRPVITKNLEQDRLVRPRHADTAGGAQ